MDNIKFKDENGKEIIITNKEWEELMKKGIEKNAEYKRHIKSLQGLTIRNYNQKYGR